MWTWKSKPPHKPDGIFVRIRWDILSAHTVVAPPFLPEREAKESHFQPTSIGLSSRVTVVTKGMAALTNFWVKIFHSFGAWAARKIVRWQPHSRILNIYNFFSIPGSVAIIASCSDKKTKNDRFGCTSSESDHHKIQS